MNRLLLGLALSAIMAAPAAAALKVGDAAPDFSLVANQAGKGIPFKLSDALKKGPVVVYFFPSAYTRGCDLQARTFAENREKFDVAGASIIGVSADSTEKLRQFSADPASCAGKFPVASDADHKTALAYKLNVGAARTGAADPRGANYGFIERVTYVIARDGKIAATLSSTVDGLSPDQHVDRSLAMVQQMKAK